jgi:hypothetical protein
VKKSCTGNEIDVGWQVEIYRHRSAGGAGGRLSGPRGETGARDAGRVS